MLRFISVSSLLTYFSLLSSFAAFHFALSGSMNLTAAMWGISVVFDDFDGSFAALFNRDNAQKEFGRELDSLVDCIAFAIVPVTCLRLLAFPEALGLQIAFLASSFLYVLAAVTRLGYFNISNRAGETGYTGLPTTESCLVLATVVLLPVPRAYTWIALVCLAAAMISPVRVQSPKGAFRILLVAWPLLVIVAHLLLHFLGGNS